MRTKLLIGFLLFSKLCVSQIHSPGDIFQERLYAYGINNPSQTLFIHFDKNIYVSNENAWFAAYILNPLNTLSEVLSISLVNHNNRRIVKTEQFSIMNGFSAGKIFLPDSIKPGDYDLIGYTDLLHNDKPVDLFIQPIEIRTPYRQDFSVALIPDPSPFPKNLTVKTTHKDLTASPDVEIDYAITYQEGMVTGKGRTDKNGLYVLPIPDTISKKTLHFSVDAGVMNPVQHSSLLLNSNIPGNTVRFFPEGGNLIEGIPGKVGLEIIGTNGIITSTQAILYSGDQPIDTIETDMNGMAVFQAVAEPQSKLFVRVPSGDRYTDFDLPAAVTTGVALHIEKGVLQNQLHIILTSPHKGNYQVIVHNFREAFGMYVVNFPGRSSTTIQAGLNEVPKGLATITVIDESGKPVAERMFFAHSDQKSTFTVSSDKQVYSTGQQITLSIEGTTEKTSGGVISIGCVNTNRINPSNFTDIISYGYLYHEMGSLNTHLHDSLASLEKLLLIKGWRRYSLAALVNTKENDTVTRLEKIAYKGSVINSLGEKLKTETTLNLFKDSTMSSILTDNQGEFTLSNENLLTNSITGRINLFVNGNKNKEYTIQMFNPNQVLLQELIDSLFNGLPVYVTGKERPKQTGDFIENVSVLNSVVVTSKPSIRSQSPTSKYRGNDCGDFVCVQETLNCPVHKPTDPGSYPPVKGKTYLLFALSDNRPYHIGQTGYYIGRTVYTGCTIEERNKKEGMFIVQGIQTLKEFYMPAENDPQQPSNTTLYWESLRELSAGEKYDAHFNSGSTAGTYRIVVQGIYNNQPIFREITITVR
jgi:hypothetical protein